MTHEAEHHDDEEKLHDLLTMMIAGSDTTSHSLVSCLYYLQKYPKVCERLIKELSGQGLYGVEDIKVFEEKLDVDVLNQLTYLNNVIKETFRIDTAASDANDYLVKEDIKICGVPIGKGEVIKIEVLTPHYSAETWMNPLDFEPERHNPESEVYQEAKNKGIVTDVYSRRSFGHGARSCPGQVLANLEMKVIIAYLISNGIFKFEQKDIDNEGIGFGMGTNFNPIVKVSKVPS